MIQEDYFYETDNQRKPSVAQSIATVIGAKQRGDGYLEGGGYLVPWCLGHLAELASADAIKENILNDANF